MFLKLVCVLMHSDDVACIFMICALMGESNYDFFLFRSCQTPSFSCFFVLKWKKWSSSHRYGWFCFSINKNMASSEFALLTKLIVPAISSTNCTQLTGSYHGYKMQQIHAWLVGFGVSQFEQGWNPKSSSVPGIPPLRSHIQGQNNTHGQTHIHTL